MTTASYFFVHTFGILPILQYLCSKVKQTITNMQRIHLSLLLLLAICASSAHAQRHEILNPRIATLQVVAGTNWQAMPITHLGGLPIHIYFYYMTHDYLRYTYKI